MIPDFGDGKSRRRLGDIMSHAKLYLLTQVGVAGAEVSQSNAVNELAMWHVIGDPTLEIWTENPNPNLLPGEFTFEQGEDSATLTYAVDGAIATAYQVSVSRVARAVEFVAIGRARVADGRAAMEYFQQPLRGLDVFLVVNAENAVSRYLAWARVEDSKV